MIGIDTGGGGCFLFSVLNAANAPVVDYSRRGILDVTFSLAEETKTIITLLKKYRNVPMSLADACLVRMAERRPGALVFTLDSDFSIYRKNGRRKIPTLTPPAAPAR